MYHQGSICLLPWNNLVPPPWSRKNWHFFGTRSCTSINTRINLPALDPLARRVLICFSKAGEFEGGVNHGGKIICLSKADPTWIHVTFAVQLLLCLLLVLQLASRLCFIYAGTKPAQKTIDHRSRCIRRQ